MRKHLEQTMIYSSTSVKVDPQNAQLDPIELQNSSTLFGGGQASEGQLNI